MGTAERRPAVRQPANAVHGRTPQTERTMATSWSARRSRRAGERPARRQAAGRRHSGLGTAGPGTAGPAAAGGPRRCGPGAAGPGLRAPALRAPHWGHGLPAVVPASRAADRRPAVMSHPACPDPCPSGRCGGRRSRHRRSQPSQNGFPDRAAGRSRQLYGLPGVPQNGAQQPGAAQLAPPSQGRLPSLGLPRPGSRTRWAG